MLTVPWGKPQLTHWRFKKTTIEVGAKVIFDENGPLYISLSVKPKVFASSKRRMVSNVRISSGCVTYSLPTCTLQLYKTLLLIDVCLVILSDDFMFLSLLYVGLLLISLFILPFYVCVCHA